MRIADLDAVRGHLTLVRRLRRRAFTLVEFLVVFWIAVILLSIFVPYLLRIRENDRRVRCQANLRQIRDALGVYARDNGSVYPRVVYDEAGNPNGYTSFTGADEPHPFAPDSTVKPNDVTASLWLLVRSGLVEPGVFVCPSSGDERDLMTDAAGRFVKATARGNFRRSSNLSYSYSSPFSSAPGYRMDDTRKGDFALLADKSPGIGRPGGKDGITGASWDAATIDRSRANSRNHGRAGQNVLYADGSVNFERTVYCGVGKATAKAGDNIYTALSPTPLIDRQLPAYNTGFWAHDVGPAWEGDSYLVPTAGEGPGVAPTLTVRRSPTTDVATRPIAAATTQAVTTQASPAATTATAPVTQNAPATTGSTSQPSSTQP